MHRILGVIAAAGLALACSPADDPGGGDAGPEDGREDGTADTGSCASLDPYCSPDFTQVLACDPATGTPAVRAVCAAGEACVGGACRSVVCVPGRGECVDETTVNACRPDGSGFDVVSCPPGKRCDPERGVCDYPCRLRVFILLDQSGSMGGEVRPTKWEQARTAIATLMTSAGAEEVEFGLGAFPTGGDSCGTGAQVIHPVPEATAENVDEYFATRVPNGATPLLEAVNLHLVDTSANLNDPAYHNFLLVVSDGADTCHQEECTSRCGLMDIACQLRCQENADAEVIAGLADAAAYLRDDLALRTFVIGFGEGVSGDQLAALAENGGTTLGRWLPAADVEELAAAFERILAEMLECSPIVL